MGFSESRVGGGTADPDRMPKMSDAMFGSCCDLYECLCGFNDAKGKYIPGCKITLYMEGVVVKAAVNDPYTNRVGFMTLDPSLTLTAALIEVLEGPGIEWRNSRGKRQ